MSVINDIKKLVGNSRLFVEAEKLEEKQNKGKNKRSHKGKWAREAVKIGQGGTLDPLADGVLVVGVGKGTKRLNEFLDCVKVRFFNFVHMQHTKLCRIGIQNDCAPWLRN